MSGAVAATLGSSGAIGAINGALPSAAQAIGANWVIKNDGTYLIDGGGSGNWVTPTSSAIAALYQVQSVVTSGTFTLDPSAGSFVDCATTRTWTKTGSGTVTFTVTFRVKSTGSIVMTQAGVQIVVP